MNAASSSDRFLYPSYVVVDAVDIDPPEILTEQTADVEDEEVPRSHPFDSVVLKCCLLAVWLGVMLFELDLMKSIKCSQQILMTATPLRPRAIYATPPPPPLAPAAPPPAPTPTVPCTPPPSSLQTHTQTTPPPFPTSSPHVRYHVHTL